MVAERSPKRTVLPTSAGSPWNAEVQKRWVSTAAPAALGPSSPGPSSRPSTGRRPITLKYEPPTTPARTWRGSPRPTIVNSITEKSPNSDSDLMRPWRSRSSGTEKLVLSLAMPGALCRR